MQPGELLKPLGVFVAVLVVIVGGAFAAPFLLGGDSAGTPDGAAYQPQSPNQYEPSNVIVEPDPEEGELSIDANVREEKRILVDTQHGNSFSEEALEPVVNTLVRNGHDVDFGAPSSGGGFGSGSGSYNETLQQYDAVLVIAPTASFSDSEVAGLKAYAEGGGRVVVLAEPTQTQLTGGGLFAAPTQVQTEVDNLAGEFGMKLGSESLYNIDNDRNENNYQSILATTTSPGPLTSDVGEVDLALSGYIVTTGQDSDATVKYRAMAGTKKLSTRRAGEYPVAARNGNFVMVADSSFITSSEVYDADNEVFVSNLLEFMVTGDKPDDVPSGGGGDGGFGGDTGTGTGSGGSGGSGGSSGSDGGGGA